MPFDVSEHYNCKVSSVSTKADRVTPTWSRVSQSPWGAKASTCAGYGRPIEGSSISDDMPLYFTRTEQLKRPQLLKDVSGHGKNVDRSSSMETSLVLPGSNSVLTNKPKHGNRFKKLNHGKQVLLAPCETPRDSASLFPWTSRSSGRADARPSSSSCSSQFPSSSRIATARSTVRSQIDSSRCRSKLLSSYVLGDMDENVTSTAAPNSNL